MDFKAKMRFTIITVVYNDEKRIDKTIESVYEQDSDEFEYIIIDGESTDNTIEIASKFKDLFINRNIEFRIFSEKDKGVYDAMNKGISYAKGEFVCFMNSGDRFYDEHTLGRISQYYNDNPSVDIMYGDTIEYKSNGLIRKKEAQSIDVIEDDMPFCHQSAVTRTELMVMHPFDLDYRICADHDFYMWCYTNNYRFHHINTIVSKYEFGGLSSCEGNEIVLLRERLAIKKKYLVIDDTKYCEYLVELEKKERKKKIKSLIKRIIPNRLLEKRTYKLDMQKGWINE